LTRRPIKIDVTNKVW